MSGGRGGRRPLGQTDGRLSEEDAQKIALARLSLSSTGLTGAAAAAAAPYIQTTKNELQSVVPDTDSKCQRSKVAVNRKFCLGMKR